MLTCSCLALAQDPTLLAAVSGTMATVPVNPKPFLNDLTGILDKLCQRLSDICCDQCSISTCLRCYRGKLVLCKLKWGALDGASMHNASDVARLRFKRDVVQLELVKQVRVKAAQNPTSEFHGPCQLNAAAEAMGTPWPEVSKVGFA